MTEKRDFHRTEGTELLDHPSRRRSEAPLLEVADLQTHFHTREGTVRAVDGVSFSVEPGEVLGIVGESGCGKSVSCMTIMGLTPRDTSTSTGSVLFQGEELLGAPTDRLRRLRGNKISMIFQDPMTAMNPVHKVGHQLVEAVLLHNDVPKSEARRRAVDMLKAVGIPNAERRLDDYPHQFSGGMRQRVMIATALINTPDLVIADEPTTALDVTTQAQILRLLRRLQKEFHTAVLMVTHDLSVVAETADNVVVMYAGKVVESAAVTEIFHGPRHPYTWGLLGSLPRLYDGSERLSQISGQPPSLVSLPDGCSFHPRCQFAFDTCAAVEPPLLHHDGSARAEACHLDESVKLREGAALRERLSAHKR